MRDAGQRAEHRGARRERRIVGPTNAPISTMTPMMNAQASPACQAQRYRRLPVAVLQIDRQHDHEDDDEHVRHARAVRHRRHVGCGPPSLRAARRGRRRTGCRAAARCPGPAGSGRRRCRRRAARPRTGTSLVSTITLSSTLVNRPKKRVPVARHPPAWSAVSAIRMSSPTPPCCRPAAPSPSRGVPIVITPSRRHVSTSSARVPLSERARGAGRGGRFATQPKMPPCALIISSAQSLELREVRGDAVREHQAVVAAVVRLAHRGVDAHLGGHAADDELPDAAALSGSRPGRWRRTRPCRACR